MLVFGRFTAGLLDPSWSTPSFRPLSGWIADGLFSSAALELLLCGASGDFLSCSGLCLSREMCDWLSAVAEADFFFFHPSILLSPKQAAVFFLQIQMMLPPPPEQALVSLFQNDLPPLPMQALFCFLSDWSPSAAEVDLSFLVSERFLSAVEVDFSFLVAERFPSAVEVDLSFLVSGRFPSTAKAGFVFFVPDRFPSSLLLSLGSSTGVVRCEESTSVLGFPSSLPEFWPYGGWDGGVLLGDESMTMLSCLMDTEGSFGTLGGVDVFSFVGVNKHLGWRWWCLVFLFIF